MEGLTLVPMEMPHPGLLPFSKAVQIFLEHLLVVGGADGVVGQGVICEQVGSGGQSLGKVVDVE